ncbi:MAG TPA: xanthine dehydrogenase accessory protein XdhC [Burkholderiaceae bacterium]
MSHWLDVCLDITAPCVLVTVAAVDGSGPRESGAKMIVTADSQMDTIGGGHLELKACELAREMLRTGVPARRFERFALGPGLGQCCGGVVYLAFEVFDQAAKGELEVMRERLRRGEDSWRLVPLDESTPAILIREDRQPISPLPLAGEGTGEKDSKKESTAAHSLSPAPLCPYAGHPYMEEPLAVGECRSVGDPHADRNPDLTASGRGEFQTPMVFTPQRPCHIMRDTAGKRWLVDPCLAHRPHLVLFGAGHVGTAIVRFLADLPCRVTWVDEREDLFPQQVPANVTIEATDTPEAIADQAPQGATFLVLTHSHTLDQTLSEHILKRPGNDWFGLIGSRTKRMQFEHRLSERGITRAKLDAMICPIGIPGIAGKEPAVIAAAVAAQLLQVWEAQARAVPLDAQPRSTQPAKAVST